ncbi:MAG: hypothetical protein HYU66_07875 [Armatimonadetes bacterium]|nr:hypothetical protein [Armatimonadota bacterium]
MRATRRTVRSGYYVEPENWTEDLAGRRLELPADTPWLSLSELPAVDYRLPRRNAVETLVALGRVDSGPDGVYAWWRPVRGGQAWLVCYDPVTRRLMGSLGEGGFEPGKRVASRPFALSIAEFQHGLGHVLTRPLPFTSGAPGGSRSSTGTRPPEQVFLLTGGRVWRLDIGRREVRELYREPGLLSVSILFRTASRRAAGPPDYDLCLSAPDRLVVLDPLTGVHTTYRRPVELRGELSFGVTDSGLAVARYSRTHGRDTEVAYFAPDGRITRQLRWSRPASGPERVPTPSTRWVHGAATAGPLMAGLGVAVEALALAYPERPTTAPEVRGRWACLAVGALAGLLAAVLTLRRQRRWAGRCTAAWGVLAALFGLPGYVGYLTHRRWPARVKCPGCGKPTPCDHPRCIGCGDELPGPEARDTDVIG